MENKYKEILKHKINLVDDLMIVSNDIFIQKIKQDL